MAESGLVTGVKSVLLVTQMTGAENCAAALEKQLSMEVVVAATRREALSALRRRAFSVVVLEEALAVSDAQGAELVWQHAGTALPVQVNFAIAGTARLVREIKSAMQRGAQEQTVARRAAAMDLESELRTAVTGILLQTELALREPEVPPAVEAKLRHLAELAGGLRERLRA
jgi:DNA-binding NtrC family response regulator